MSGYPVVIPDVVLDRLRKFFRQPGNAVCRPAEMFGGKSAADWVADGDGTWEQVLTKYEVMFSYQVTQ